MKKGKPFLISILLNVVLLGAILLVIGGKMLTGPRAGRSASNSRSDADGQRGSTGDSFGAQQGTTTHASLFADDKEAPSPQAPANSEGAEGPRNGAQTQQVSSGSGQSQQAPDASVVADEEQPADVPLVFLEPDPSMLSDENQVNALVSLQQRFVTAVGDPNAPGYRERWQKAQERLDDDFRAQFGNDAFNALINKRSTMSSENPAAAAQ